MSICLACQKPLNPDEHSYHANCLKLFWQEDAPVLKLVYESSQIEELAKENLAKRIIVSGVQPKLSLGFSDVNRTRLTIVGALSGRYILKPPFSDYNKMPETEAVCMLLTRACGIETVPFLLIPLEDGPLAFLTRRIDRDEKGNKFAMEDACQFTGRFTEHKYRGSYEQIAKAIFTFAQNPLLDLVRFYEQVVVSFLIGNNDMHLKNFSLISTDGKAYSLAPAYDMIAAQLLMPDDPEEMALTINGKKRSITKADFDIAMAKAHIPKKAIENLWARIGAGIKHWPQYINTSFLETEQKKSLLTLIEKKLKQLDLKL